jgi:hypothetical protein
MILTLLDIVPEATFDQQQRKSLRIIRLWNQENEDGLRDNWVTVVVTAGVTSTIDDLLMVYDEALAF